MSVNKQKLSEDLMFGLKSEQWIKHILSLKYGDLEKLDKYNNFDFKGDKIWIEVKTRRIYHDQYPSLMFSKKKLDKGLEHYLDNGDNVVFIWRCYDGIYYWDYIKDDVISKAYTIEMSGRKDRDKDEIEECVHVKTSDLTKFSIA